MRFDSIRAVTFDCYGTLIDWETGLLAALTPVFSASGLQIRREAALRSFARHERAIEAGAYMTYREVLTEVCRRMAGESGLRVPAGREGLLAESIPDWPAFEETPEVLRRLKKRFRLAVLSNIDDDLFDAPGGTRERLGVELDELVTAQHVRSYKPGRAHFEEALRRLALKPPEILHVAESRYHDIAPATAMGFRTAWVNRHATGDASASGESDAEADVEVRTLRGLLRIGDR
jgi:2-haloacid dehalogenase